MKHNSITLFLLISLFLSLQANALELEDLDGNRRDMNKIIGQGKWVVVNVWSPSCSFCVQELPHMRAFYEKNKGNIDVVGVTVDFPSFEYGKVDVIRELMAKEPIPYPLYLADHGLASTLIGGYLKAIPLVVIYHPDGRVLGRWPGEIDGDEVKKFIQEYDQYGTEEWGLDS